MDASNHVHAARTVTPTRNNNRIECALRFSGRLVERGLSLRIVPAALCRPPAGTMFLLKNILNALFRKEVNSLDPAGPPCRRPSVTGGVIIWPPHAWSLSIAAGGRAAACSRDL